MYNSILQFIQNDDIKEIEKNMSFFVVDLVYFA